MIGWAVLFFVLALLLAVMAVKPRATWRLTAGWQFKDPQGAELHDWMYALSSVASAFFALTFLGVGIWFLVEGDALECERVLGDLEDAVMGVDFDTSPLDEFDVRWELRRTATDLGVELEEHGSSFEVIDEDGEVLGVIDEDGVHSRCG